MVAGYMNLVNPLWNSGTKMSNSLVLPFEVALIHTQQLPGSFNCMNDDEIYEYNMADHYTIYT